MNEADVAAVVACRWATNAAAMALPLNSAVAGHSLTPTTPSSLSMFVAGRSGRATWCAASNPSVDIREVPHGFDR